MQNLKTNIKSIIALGLIISLTLGSFLLSPPQNTESPKGFSSQDLIYFVLTDRYKDGSSKNNQFEDTRKSDPKAYHGGDFVGLTQSLDYIKTLGATAIWITPVVSNQAYGYHGYWAVDFENVDPHLGTLTELQTLVSEAHKRDMKVILDYVVNHTGPTSPWLNDPEKKLWFHEKRDITNWSNQAQVENNWLMGLPDLNTENPEVKAYFLQNAKDWIEKTGIDGMRLDTMRHVPKSFWKEFSSSIKATYPNFYLLGEVWNDNVRYLQLYNDDGIDGLTDYSLYKGITGTFSPSGSSSATANAVNKAKFFKNPGLNGIFIDNHDNPRYITTYGKAYTKQALAFLMTYPSIPVIYYGTEIGLEGRGDPDNRRDMDWEVAQTGNDMSNYYQKLLNIRQQNLATTKGTLTVLKTSKDLLVYKLMLEDKGLLVVMNLRNKPLIEKVPLTDENASLHIKKTLLKEGSGEVFMEKKDLNLTLSPQEIMIFTAVQ